MLYWNPDKFFTIPFLNVEMSWYFFFWDLGFILSLILGFLMLERFFWNYPEVFKADLKKTSKKNFLLLEKLNLEINQQVEQDLNPKYRGFEVKNSAKLLKRFALEKAYKTEIISLRMRSLKLSLECFAYIVIFVFLGARIFHFVSYEDPSRYLTTPWILLKVWNGGRASHGGIVGLFVAMLIFCYRQKKNYPAISWIKIADIIFPCGFFALAFIRFGNFFAQEILGKETLMPWGVVYGFPINRSEPMALHPVQLYEALGCFCLGFFLLHLVRKSKNPLGDGKISGLAIILAAFLRIFCEFFKQEQSKLMVEDPFFTMGQWLSVPFIFFGLYLYFHKEISLWMQSFRKSNRPVKD